MARPESPTQDAEALARALHDVDLSGGASTAADRMTEGDASKGRAVLNGSGISSRSPAAPTLLATYARWRAAQDAATAATKATPPDRTAAEVERKAMRKSAQHLGKKLREGVSPAVACASAHGKYRKHGGRSTFGVWARKIAAG